jgi:protein SCO1/2
MSKPVKRLTLAMWLMAVVLMVLLVAMKLSVRDQTTSQEATDIIAPNFSLTDQQGRTVSTSDLKGHPWIADFIFTECASACPLMSQRLSTLQTRIPADVKFVSFTVDPEHDTPAKLLDYAKQYGADNDRWRFLTGDKDKVMEAIHGMKVSVVPAAPGNQIEHDIHYLLMDGDGRLRGVYDSRLPDQIEALVKDAAALSGGTHS